MSDDIVERLMICAKYDPDQKEAADEIKRLRAERDALRAELATERDLREREKDAAVAMMQVKIDALASERKVKTIYYDEWQAANNQNGRLRELLREARGWLTGKDYELAARIDTALNRGGGK